MALGVYKYKDSFVAIRYTKAHNTLKKNVSVAKKLSSSTKILLY